MSRCLLLHLHLRTETDPVAETSCSPEYQTMEKVQNPSNSEEPSSYPLTLFLKIILLYSPTDVTASQPELHILRVRYSENTGVTKSRTMRGGDQNVNKTGVEGDLARASSRTSLLSLFLSPRFRYCRQPLVHEHTKSVLPLG
jgi:hypothetical protein